MSATTNEDFDAQVRPYRQELVVHCYRLLGSVHDADDLVQETLLRAWRAWGSYDRTRASVRTWLYTIATNACLTALQGRARRPMPSGLGARWSRPCSCCRRDSARCCCSATSSGSPAPRWPPYSSPRRQQ